MSTTDNLALTLIETNQSQKEVTANEAFAGLDAAICETLDVQVEDGTNTVAAADVRGAVQLVLLDEGSPGLSAAFTLELAAVKRLLVITNTTAYDATVVCDGAASGAEEVVVVAGGTRTVYCDGTQVFGMVADAVADPPYDIGAFIAGEPTGDEIVMRFVASRAFSLPASLTGSYAKAETAATASTDFDIQKNGSSIGTLNFAISGDTGTWTFASPVSFAAGDILSVVAQTTPDATLADISITFAGTRS